MKLKIWLVTISILTLPFGCVLIQYGKVVTYASQQPRLFEENYLAHDLEFVAVIYTLKIWRHNLYGSKFEIFIDHKTLKYMSSQSNLNMRQWRWMELRKDYDCEIQYNSGKANRVVDALS